MLNDQVKEGDMSRIYSRIWRRGMHTGFWWESQKERNHQEDQDVGEWIILR
jgi:hypothetical protein